MKKLIAVAFGSIAALGVASASAQPVHHTWRHHGPYYDYAPGYNDDPAPAVRSGPLPGYQYRGPYTGTQENREQWDPGYVGGAPE